MSLGTEFKIKIGGRELDASTNALLARVVVDDTLDLPSYFAITFKDSSRRLIKDGKLEIGTSVEITARGGERSWEKLIVAEVTALELERSQSGGTYTIVRGYDTSHRLHGRPRTMAFKGKGYDTVVKEVLGKVGATVGTVESPAGKPPDQINQIGQTDWDFLRKIARLSGMTLAVEDGKVNFAKPPAAAKAGSPRGQYDADTPFELNLGQDIKQLRAVVSAGSQVAKVEVRGWDVKAKRVIKETVPVTTEMVQVGEDPAAMANKFKADVYVESAVPYGLQTDVKAAARSIADHIASAHAELEGVAVGNPRLKAGVAISLANVGKPFEGKYTLTNAHHTFTPAKGFVTAFRVSGRQDRSLFKLTSGGNGSGSHSGGFGGVTIGEVTDINDPDKLGRVKLRLPRFDDAYVSDWSRVVQPSGGKGEKGQRGLFAPPKVGDEVLVVFEHGDVNAPIVIGALINGKDKGVPSEYADTGKGRTTEMTLMSDVGHKLSLGDKQGEEGILIVTADDKMTIHLSQKDKKILINVDHPDGVHITTTGTTTVEADKAVMVKTKDVATIDASKDITLKSGGTIKLEATKDVVIDAKMKVTAKAGTEAKLEAGTNFVVKGGMNATLEASMNATVKGNVGAELSGSATATIKGGIVKIN